MNSEIIEKMEDIHTGLTRLEGMLSALREGLWATGDKERAGFGDALDIAVEYLAERYSSLEDVIISARTEDLRIDGRRKENDDTGGKILAGR